MSIQARKAAREQAAGLRSLADMLEQHPELAVRLESATRGMGNHGDYGKVCASWGPVSLYLQADREQVCERVVTGVEKVTKTIKDPAAVAALPDIEVTEEVPTYEWQCRRPLLAEVAGDGA